MVPSTHNNRVVITGGGTGGHVFPALAIAEELKERGFDTLYVGSPDGMEAAMAPAHGVNFVPIRSVQIKNKSVFHSLFGLFTLIQSVFRALGLLRKQKPSAVVGVGGYVSVPVAFSSFLLRIPLYLQEQNVSVGIANRFLGLFAKTIFLGFDKAKASFPKERCIVSGNPIRSEFNENVGPINYERPCLFVFGGSQGARAINDAFLAALSRIYEKHPAIHIIHQTGKSDFDRVKQYYEENVTTEYEVTPFIQDMLGCYEKATLVVSRAGALTISELLAVHRPAILVPFPRSGQNDQVDNSYLLEGMGVARVVEQGPDFGSRFGEILLQTLEPQTIEKMEKSFSPLPKSNALATIADHLERDIKGDLKPSTVDVP